MVSTAEFRGGSKFVLGTFAGDPLIPYGTPRIWMLNASTTGANLTLPDLDDMDLPVGKKLLGIANVGSNSFDLIDQNSLGINFAVASLGFVWVSNFEDSSGGSAVRGLNWFLWTRNALT